MNQEKLIKQNDENNKLTRYLSLVNEIVIVVNQTLDLDKMLQNVLNKIIELLNLDSGIILLIDEKTNVLSPVVEYKFLNKNKKLLESLNLKLKDNISEKEENIKQEHEIDNLTGKQGVLNIQNNMPEEGLNIFCTPKIISEKDEGNSFISFPLKSKDQILGLIIISTHQKNHFNSTELQLFSFIGNTIGIAIDNDKLFESVKNYNKDLSKEVQKYTKDLEDAKKAALNMLEDLNESYTKLKENQALLIQKEKMAAMGQMSAAISHELRNPLSNMNTILYFINTKCKFKDTFPECEKGIKNIEKEMKRMDKIISNILEFSRPQNLFFNLTDINALIEEVLNQEIFINEEKFKKIEIIKKFKIDLPKTKLDIFRIKQVLLNLIVNASEAIENDGKIIIETDVINNEIEIKIIDNGCGIQKENLSKIFEPFFSNKARGVGLGLAISRVIIEAHNGSIFALSEIGKGTVMEIKLPIRQV